MNLGGAATGILLGLALCFLGLASVVRARQVPGGRRAGARHAVTACCAVCTLALSCEGFSARHVLEGPMTCLGDMPGGYCFHVSCDVVAYAEPERPFSVSVLRAAR